MICGFVLCFLALSIRFAGDAAFADEVPGARRTEEEPPRLEERMKGVWVATVLNLDYPRIPSAKAEVLKKEALLMIETVRELGLNSIFLQVRPSGDALYRSKIVPWSGFLTGARGASPEGDFDPLAFWVEECHKRGIQLHAWMNPYRLTTGEAAVLSFPKEWVLDHTDGRKYLNPGVPAVREHLLSVVREILSAYAVDGIHFDDYFYPGSEVEDSAAFSKYNPRGLSLSQWRVENVDLLVKEVHAVCAAKKVKFGISPFGIWANRKSHHLGSRTAGFESLISQYADTRKWVKNGWVDYIAPQLYWHCGYDIADYEELVRWWADVVRGTRVDLYVGMAAYKALDGVEGSPWQGTAELLKQLNVNQLLPEVDGELFFRYRSIADRPELFRMLQNYYRRGSAAYVSDRLLVGRPHEDVSTYGDHFFIGGNSDPSHPLHINGEEIKNRSASGLFGKYYPLAKGDNVFRLVNGAQSATRTVTRLHGSSYAASPISEITSGFPSSGKAYAPGESFTLYCVAPSGCEVVAVLGGVRYKLQQRDSAEMGYPAVYEKTISLSPSGAPRVVWLGHAKYECYRNGALISVYTAGSPIEIIMKNAALYAVVKDEFADTYLDNSREIGAFHLIPAGSREYVTGEDGDLYRLQSGLWVKIQAVDLVWQSLPYNRVRTVLSERTESEEIIKVTAAYSPVVYADLRGDELWVKYNHLDIRESDIANIRGAIIESARMSDGHVVLKLRSGSYSGYYTRIRAEGEVELVIRKKKSLSSADLPLKGIVIMIDPGHGGHDTGGISLYGTAYSEKDLVLHLSYRLMHKLEEKGATVLLTRADDHFVSLYDRLRLSRHFLPDLFLSMHTDSLGETSDLSKVRGASAFFRHGNAEGLARAIAKTIYDRSELNSRGASEYNFYVCRGTWTPSLLLENGFACSPFDLEFITDFVRSETLLNDYVQDILDYFAK